MKRWVSYAIVAVLFLACGLGTAVAQKEPRPGNVIVPPSNVVPQKYRGRRAHTNFLIFVPGAKKGGAQPAFTGTAPSGETPQSLSCLYQTWAGNISGCPINPPKGSSYNAPSGGTNIIAIVDAYDYPTAASDFQTFSQEFGLPYGKACGPNQNEACLTVDYAAGSQPKANCSWAQEEALDIEWAHSMAPQAQIILVEAASNSNTNLMNAVQYATNLVANAGGGEVSMSWGSSESSTESTYDGYFTGKGVTYVASSGDNGGKVIWPSASPNVVSAGGTTVNRNSSGSFTGETAWSDAGGGPSKYEPVPGYQSGIYTLAQLLNGFRGTPDLSFDANPSTGVSVYDSTSCQGLSGWLVFGGTSVAAPSLSGIFNLSGNFSGNNSVQTDLYANYSSASSSGTSTPYSGTFYDVTSGSAGSYSATKDWDFATGIGSDRGLTGMTGSTSSVTVSSLSFSPTTVTSGTSSTGTVTLSAAPTSNVSVSLSSSNTGAAQVPSSVTVDAGKTSATFTVDTGTVTTSTTVTITASYNNTSANATLTVNPAASSVMVSSLTLNPTSVTGGTSSTGTVTLSAAPTSNVSVSLSSSNTGAAQVPSSVTVAAGNTSASFTVTTSTVSTSTSATITASYNNTSANATLTVNPAATTGSFSLSASPGNVTLHGGGTATYSITVTPSGGFDQAVNFGVSSSPPLPQGTTVSSIPSVTGSGTTTLSVTVPSGTKGNYTLVITGSTDSGLSQSVSVGLKTR